MIAGAFMSLTTKFLAKISRNPKSIKVPRPKEPRNASLLQRQNG